MKFHNDFVIKRCHHRGVCSQRSNRDVQPTREQFEFVLVAEEKQDEETQDGDDGQHGDDDTGGRRPCKTQRKKKRQAVLSFTIFSAQLEALFRFALRLTRYMRSTHCVGLGAARLDFSSAFSLAAASFFVEEPPELELKAKLARR